MVLAGSSRWTCSATRKLRLCPWLPLSPFLQGFQENGVCFFLLQGPFAFLNFLGGILCRHRNVRGLVCVPSFRTGRPAGKKRRRRYSPSGQALSRQGRDRPCGDNPCIYAEDPCCWRRSTGWGVLWFLQSLSFGNSCLMEQLEIVIPVKHVGYEFYHQFLVGFVAKDSLLHEVYGLF